MSSISNPYLSQRFQSLIWYCLDSDLVRTAIFYAERYFTVDQDNHEARHLLATCLLRGGQTLSALHLVNLAADTPCPACLELYSKCCVAVGRYSKARTALETCMNNASTLQGPNGPSREARCFPEDAALHCRSGVLAVKANLPQQAIASFTTALSLNPLLWEAYEGLCAVGSFPDINDVLPPRPRQAKQSGPDDSTAFGSERRGLPVASGAGFFTPEAAQAHSLRSWKPDVANAQPFRINNARESISTVESSFYGPGDGSMQVFTNHRGLSPSSFHPNPFFVPGRGALYAADESGPATKKARSSQNVENAGLARAAAAQSSKARTNPAASSDVFSSRANQAPARPAKAEGSFPARRSTRLQANVGTVQPSRPVKHPPAPRDRRRAKTRTASRSTASDMDEDQYRNDALYSPPSSVAQSPRSEASPAPSAQTAAQESAAQQALEFEAADDYIYELMRIFARALRAMARFQCMDAIQELETLPKEQQQCASVMVLVARAHYEMVEYSQAERAFQAARELDPYRLHDMEVYSTLLWHLQRHVQLSFLSQELLSIDARAPQAWIAVGNCFSLQRERSRALTCFRRATQLDPNCAYAYTLSGHESIEDDQDKAITFFQSALRADPRHYNAWYGLGTCYLRMSRLRLAEYHYRRASDLHPANAVLLGCVGMVVERRAAPEEALALFDRAVEISPENALVRYRRSKILMALKRYDDALQDLVKLRDIAPEESNVVFQLAKLYRLMGDDVRAAQHLAIARDISPKSLSKIKKLMATDRDGLVEDESATFDMDEG